MNCQGVDRFTGQFLTQGAVDELVLPHSAQAGEGRRDDANLKMIASAGQILHLHRRVGKCALDGLADRIRLNHGSLS